jgi:transposase InsO family protein
MHGPFAGIEDAQAAADAWRKEYNTSRPHQSLSMGFPRPGSPVLSPVSWACGYRPSSRGQPSLWILVAVRTMLPGSR